MTLYKSKRLVQAARIVYFVEYRWSRSRFLSLFSLLGRYITLGSIRKRDFTFFGAITLRIVQRTTCDKRNQTGRSCLPCTECTFERLEHSASFGNFYILWCIQIDKLILRSTVLYCSCARTCIRAVCYNDACSKRIGRQNRSMTIEQFYKNEFSLLINTCFFKYYTWF